MIECAFFAQGPGLNMLAQRLFGFFRATTSQTFSHAEINACLIIGSLLAYNSRPPGGSGSAILVAALATTGYVALDNGNELDQQNPALHTT